MGENRHWRLVGPTPWSARAGKATNDELDLRRLQTEVSITCGGSLRDRVLSGSGPESFDELADLVGLVARSVRWLARTLKQPDDAARLVTIAEDIDKIQRRLIDEGKQRARSAEARPN